MKAYLIQFKTFLDEFDPDQNILALETRVQSVKKRHFVFKCCLINLMMMQSIIENALQDENEIEVCQVNRNQFEASYFELLTRARVILQ